MTPTIPAPILRGFYPDPSICRVGHDFYLATSTFEYFPGVPIFHSRDLVNWRQLGHALTRDSQLSLVAAKSSGGIYAPTLRHHNGVFYLVTTNVSGAGNFYVTARDPAGEWSEPVWLPEEAGWMDPSLFFDDDGKVYFTRHGDGERGCVYQAELDIATGKLKQAPRKIWSGTGGVWPEGPHLFKRHGWYYLTIAEGGTGYDHMQTIARARSPFGPFESCPGNPILTHRDRPEHPIQAIGHADFVEDAAGRWWMVFLGVRPATPRHHHLGRETFLARVQWSSDGWPEVNFGDVPEGLPNAQPWPNFAARDDFDAPELGLEYNFVRNPERERYQLAARAGYLRLLASATGLDEVGPPTFVGRRQAHFECTMRAALEFEPRYESDEAGLVLRANEAHHYALLVVSRAEGRRVIVRARRRGIAELIADAELGPGQVVLEIRATRERYEFSWAQGTRASLCSLPTCDLSTETAGGFTGVYTGMYARSRSGAAPPADFDWFEYAPGGE
ncbi:MAG: glycoside hydrolase family 43 protein [Myxococcota bacterium]